MTWLWDVLRVIFTWIDKAIYQLISYLYQLMLYLANIDLFGFSTIAEKPGDASTIISSFSNRIFAFLGIFMLFRLSFSIFKYLVDPDAFSDSAKGFGKLITNVIVSLLLLVFVPYIFSFAYRMQGNLLKDNMLGKLILGRSSGAVTSDSNEEIANDMRFLVYSSFVPVNDRLATEVAMKCKNTPILGTKAMANNGECVDALAQRLADDGIDMSDFFPISEDKERNFDAFGAAASLRDGDDYVFDYIPFVSTIVGGYIVFILVGFCIDIAVRAIKLGLLEIISPIPIISYMDPTQSSQDGMLSKWAHECLSTYLSLFIRLAIIYFIFFCIDLISGSVLSGDDAIYPNGGAPNGLMSGFVFVMLVIGLLTFAKQVPQLLENVFGIKNSGDITFNAFKNSAFGRTAGFIGGAALGGITTGIAAAATGADISKSKGHSGLMQAGRALKSGALGIASGAVRGGLSGGSSDQLGESMRRASQTAGRTSRNMELRSMTTLGSRLSHRARMTVGAPTKAEVLDNRIKNYEAFAKHKDNMYNRAVSKLDDGTARNSAEWNALKAQESALATKKYYNRWGEQLTGAAEMAARKKDMENIYNRRIELVADFINNENDVVINNERRGMTNDVKDIAGSKRQIKDANGNIIREERYGDYDFSTMNWDDIQAVSGDAKGKSADISLGKGYIDAQQTAASLEAAGKQRFFQGRRGNN